MLASFFFAGRSESSVWVWASVWGCAMVCTATADTDGADMRFVVGIDASAWVSCAFRGASAAACSRAQRSSTARMLSCVCLDHAVRRRPISLRLSSSNMLSRAAYDAFSFFSHSDTASACSLAARARSRRVSSSNLTRARCRSSAALKVCKLRVPLTRVLAAASLAAEILLGSAHADFVVEINVPGSGWCDETSDEYCNGPRVGGAGSDCPAEHGNCCMRS